MKIQITNRGQFIACTLSFLLIVFSFFMKEHNTNITMTACTIAIFLDLFWFFSEEKILVVVGVIAGGFISGILWFIYLTMYYPKDNTWHPIIGVWVTMITCFFLTIIMMFTCVERVEKVELQAG